MTRLTAHTTSGEPSLSSFSYTDSDPVDSRQERIAAGLKATMSNPNDNNETLEHAMIY